MLEVQQDLEGALAGQNAVVFGVRHGVYMALDPDAVVEMVGGPCVIIDAFGILPDAKIIRYLELGCTLRAVARGHIKRLAAAITAAN